MDLWCGRGLDVELFDAGYGLRKELVGRRAAILVSF